MPLTPDTEIEVARLLKASATAHLTFRQYQPHKRMHNGQLQTQTGDPLQARAALESAQAIRAEAHALDPEHVAQAWAFEPVKHDELEAFYAQQLSR